MEAKPLIVIVGPTASGKTSLAIELAEKYGGEIICADSRTPYKGMDIGTAKPTKSERARVPHWGLDLVEPNERFTAADFKKYAETKIIEIRDRGHVPFLVGGTGLYVDAVLFDYRFGDQPNEYLRQQLEKMTIEELYDYCNKYNIDLPENDKNKRYVIRAIEQKSINVKRESDPITNSIIVGIATDKEILRTRIKLRNEHILTDGVVEEAKKLGNKYGWDSEAMTGNIYRLIYQFIQGKITMQEVQRTSSVRDWQLAKRQLTWFRRNLFIKWLSLEDANTYISNELETYRKS